MDEKVFPDLYENNLELIVIIKKVYLIQNALVKNIEINHFIQTNPEFKFPNIVISKLIGYVIQ